MVNQGKFEREDSHHYGSLRKWVRLLNKISGANLLTSRPEAGELEQVLLGALGR